jgi:hypothetical protein
MDAFTANKQSGINNNHGLCVKPHIKESKSGEDNALVGELCITGDPSRVQNEILHILRTAMQEKKANLAAVEQRVYEAFEDNIINTLCRFLVTTANIHDDVAGSNGSHVLASDPSGFTKGNQIIKRLLHVQQFMEAAVKATKSAREKMQLAIHSTRNT